jgi:hypothetical protein
MLLYIYIYHHPSLHFPKLLVEYMDLVCFVPEKQKLPHSLQSLTPVSKLGYMHDPNKLISIAITKKESNQLTRKRNMIVK